MDASAQPVPQAGMSSKAVLAIILAAVVLTAAAVYLYMQPSPAAITSPEEAANASVDVARAAADLGGSLGSVQESISPS